MYGQVRDELEHLLDDDMDMAEMYLTEKLMDQRSGRPLQGWILIMMLRIREKKGMLSAT